MIYCHYLNVGFKTKDDPLQRINNYTNLIFKLNPESSHGYFLRGFIHFFKEDFKESVIDTKRALDPNNPDVLVQLSRIYIMAGKTSAAKPLVQRLIEIDPLTPLNQAMPGYIYLYDGQFEKSLKFYKKMYTMDPENPIGKYFYAWALTFNKMNNEAFQLIDQVIQKIPGSIFAQMGKFYMYAIMGDKEKALKSATADFLDSAKTSEFLARDIAHSYALIDEKSEALNWLEIAVNKGQINYPFFNEYDPFLENIRGEERFKKLMERVKHEWENFSA